MALRHALEVVVYKIENGHVVGYLSEPGAGTSGPPIPRSTAKAVSP